jgi:hypothetical protein
MVMVLLAFTLYLNWACTAAGAANSNKPKSTGHVLFKSEWWQLAFRGFAHDFGAWTA